MADSHVAGPGDRLPTVLVTTFFVTALVLAVELAGWYLSGSLAILGDGIHVFSDLISIGVSLVTIWIAMRATKPQFTFGFHRTEVFAALANGCLLLAMALLIGYDAIHRLDGSHVVSSVPMLITAFIGLLGNLYSAYLLQHDENLNIRSAFVHVAGDALSSMGVIIGGVVILFTGLYAVDAIISLIIAAIIVFSAYSIIRSSLSILLESAPYDIDAKALRNAVLGVNGVRGVHDIHVWRTCSDMVFAMMHVEINDTKLSSAHMISEAIDEHLWRTFGISHTTIQVEPYGSACENRDARHVLGHKNRRTLPRDA